jgi:hypothetical protein
MLLHSQRRTCGNIEYRYLKTQRMALIRLRGSVWRRSALSSVIVFGPLALLTLWAEGKHPLWAEGKHPGIVLTFWTIVAALITVPTVLQERRKLSRRIAAYDHALASGICADRQVVATRMWEFEEEEDEGACYAFELESGGVVFIVGQEFYASARFPNADFSLVDFFGPNGEVIDMMIVKRGPRLAAERVIAAKDKAQMKTPEHTECFEGTLEQVYAHLQKA